MVETDSTERHPYVDTVQTANRRDIEVTNFELAQMQYQKKIGTAAGKVYRYLPGYAKSDLESELLEILWLCVQKYDPDNGARFSTFFWHAAKNRIIDIRRFCGRKKRYAQLIFLDEENLAVLVDNMAQHCEFSAEDFALGLMEVERRRMPA